MARYIAAEFDANDPETMRRLHDEGVLKVGSDQGRITLQFALKDDEDDTITIIVNPKDLLGAVVEALFEE